MKTTKFSYWVYTYKASCTCPVDSFPVAKFQTLAMARNYCQFNKGHYFIYCVGYVEYKDGLEVSK